MSLKNSLYKATVQGMKRVASRNNDFPNRELRTELSEATVVRVVDLAPHLRRITLTAELFQHITLDAADEYVGLILPQPNTKFVMPDPDVLNIRAATKHLPVDLRWYTIRALRNDTAEVDIDIVTHGTTGPGSSWALSAAVDSTVGIRFVGSCYYEHHGTQFYLADPSSAPALRSIVAVLPDREKARTHILLHGTDDDLEPDFPCEELASFHRNISVEEFAAHLPFAPEELVYAWLCGESSLVTEMRRALVSKKVPKQRILFSGYWKEGVARN